MAGLLESPEQLVEEQELAAAFDQPVQIVSRVVR